jgi:hypothetical protein
MSDAAGTRDYPIIVCDANAFYSIVTTDLILSLGVAELFRPRWTNQIHDEWMRNLLANRPATVAERFSQEVCDTLEEMRARKTRPSLSQAEILRKLENQKLPKFVAALRATGYGIAQ